MEQTITVEVTTHLHIPDGKYTQREAVRLTPSHTINDLRNSLAELFLPCELESVPLAIYYNGVRTKDHERVGDVQSRQDYAKSGFSMYLDPFAGTVPSPVPLVHVIVVPRTQVSSVGSNDYDFMMELIDKIVNLKQKILETLTTETQVTLELQLTSGDKKDITDASGTLQDALELDVAPKSPVYITLSTPNAPETSTTGHDGTPTSNRVFFALISDIPKLQEGNNIFEANRSTTIAEFKQLIIERVDHDSVSRTFYDQLELSTPSGMLIGPESDHQSIADLLNSINQDLFDDSGICRLNLKIENLDGIGGLFTREFWRDLRSPNRFQFLPRDNRSLAIEEARQASRDVSSGVAQGSDFNNSANNPLDIGSPGESMAMAQGTQASLHDNTSHIQRDRSIDTATSSSSEIYSSQLYKITYEEGQGSNSESVILNTSQCIIVENDQQPYLMLSPAAMGEMRQRLAGCGSSPLPQRSQVIRNSFDIIDITPPPFSNIQGTITNTIANATVEAHHGAQPEDHPEVRPNVPRDFLLRKVLRLIGTNINFTSLGLQLLQIFILLLADMPSEIRSFLVFLYLTYNLIWPLVFNGEAHASKWEEFASDLPRTMAVRALLSTAAILRHIGKGGDAFANMMRKFARFAIMLLRTDSWVYLVKVRLGQDGPLFYATWYWTSILGDLLLFIMSSFPPMYIQLMKELQAWREGELERLEFELLRHFNEANLSELYIAFFNQLDKFDIYVAEEQDDGNYSLDRFGSLLIQGTTGIDEKSIGRKQDESRDQYFERAITMLVALEKFRGYIQELSSDKTIPFH